MTTYYVWDGGDDSDPDSGNWAEAWSDFATITGLVAGDLVLVASDHTESTAGFTVGGTSTRANPVRFCSVNRTTGDYETMADGGGSITASNDAIFTIDMILRGIKVLIGDDFIAVSAGYTEIDDCDFTMGASGSARISLSSVEGMSVVRRTAISVTSNPLNGPVISSSGDNSMLIVDATTIAVDNSIGAAYPLFDLGNYSRLICRNSDLSAHARLVTWTNQSPSSFAEFHGCKLHASWASVLPTLEYNHQYLRLVSCEDGTIGDRPLSLTRHETIEGVVSSTAAVYRTGGANDGNADYAWSMVSNATTIEAWKALVSPWIARSVDEAGSISGATAQRLTATTAANPQDTPAAISTDTSTWNGSYGGEEYKIEHTLSTGETLTIYFAGPASLNDDDVWAEISEPDQVGGPILARLCLAKPSTTVYLDPKLVVA